MRSLLDLVAGPESGGNYNAIYGQGGASNDLSQYTLDEIQALQRAHGKRTGSSAIGKYQIISKTMEGLKKDMGLPGDVRFTPALQDAMGTQLLKRRGLEKFQSGVLSPARFAHNLSMEWAGLPKDESGRSYYAGDKMGNKAGIGWGQVMSALGGAPGEVRQAASPAQPLMPQEAPGGQAMDPYQQQMMSMLQQRLMTPEEEPGLMDSVAAALGHFAGDLADTPVGYQYTFNGLRPVGGGGRGRGLGIGAGSGIGTSKGRFRDDLATLQKMSEITQLGREAEAEKRATQEEAQRIERQAQFAEAQGEPGLAELIRIRAKGAESQLTDLVGPQDPPEPPEPPEIEEINGQQVIWDQQQGAYVPAPTQGLPEVKGPPPLDFGEITQWEDRARDDYRTDTQRSDNILNYWGKVREIDPDLGASGPQQRSLVVNFAKAIDPGVSVTDSDAIAIEKAGIKMPIIHEWIKKTVDGSLPEQTQKDILSEIERYARDADASMRSTTDLYRRRAAEKGASFLQVGDEVKEFRPGAWSSRMKKAIEALPPPAPGTDIGGGITIMEGP